jgi:undecaprenyl-diphosphatase
VGHLLKVVVRRPRPDIAQVIDIREPTTGFSFPSGHSLQAAIIGVVAIIVVQQLFTGRLRRVLQLGAIWLTITVGWERVFDGVHWPTDVAGGFLLGTLLVSATWRGLSELTRRQRVHAWQAFKRFRWRAHGGVTTSRSRKSATEPQAIPAVMIAEPRRGLNVGAGFRS